MQMFIFWSLCNTEDARHHQHEIWRVWDDGNHSKENRNSKRMRKSQTVADDVAFGSSFLCHYRFHMDFFYSRFLIRNDMIREGFLFPQEGWVLKMNFMLIDKRLWCIVDAYNLLFFGICIIQNIIMYVQQNIFIRLWDA